MRRKAVQLYTSINMQTWRTDLMSRMIILNYKFWKQNHELLQVNSYS